MENKNERNKKLDLIIKIVILIIIILLFIHNCVLIKNRNCNGGPKIIDIDCNNGKCDGILKSLLVSPTNIDFKSNVTTYNIEVDSGVDEIILNAMPFEASTKVEYPSDLTLKDGTNTFKIVATTKDGKRVTYTINVNRKPKEVTDDKIVKDIKVSPKDINFSENKTKYTINVGNSVTSIDILVSTYDDSTVVSIPSDLSLKEGLNTFKVKVTTKDGKTVTYTINVNRAKKKSSLPLLKELTTSPKNIDFKSNVTTYDIEVDSDVNEIIINALPNDPSTKIIIPDDLSLKEGMNTFVVKVVGSDGTTKEYTINVNKKGKDNKVIKDITVGPKDIDFSEDVYTYDIEVDNSVNEITLSALPFDKNTQIIITPSDLTLKEGLNTFKIEATNKDGIKKVYTINVTRKGDTRVLKDITVGPVDIDFSEDVYTYDIEVENDIAAITIDAIAYASTTTISIPSNLSLEVGLNTFKVEATNKDGIKKVYTINVTRKDAETGFIVKDKDIRWSEGTTAEIFENPLYDRGKLIAPESKNTYEFTIKNSTGYKLIYKIDFIEENPYYINMKYKLKKNGTYIVDSYSIASALNIANIVLDVNSSDVYDLEWYWISSSNDTEIGKTPNASYSLKIDIEAEEY